MVSPSHAGPGLARRLTAVFAVALLLIAANGSPRAAARAAGNASSAAGFVENAQNADGGFSEKRGQPSNPTASLWAAVALLSAGKRPSDERVNNGSSADAYLAGHVASYRSLGDLGLLATIQGASGVPAARYGNPAAQLKADLTIPAIRSNPGGAALAAIGMLAVHANGIATGAARTLLNAAGRDGGWGQNGSSDSASTALVLEALAQSGVAVGGNAAIRKGIEYLGRAQVNDGSIATSDRTDASSSGDVAATAFTIQALSALHHVALRTATGTTVLAGLTSYQQRGSGGLSPFGAYDTGVAPSVTETAQAYPAFDGVAFPLPFVAAAPARPKHTTARAAPRASAGTVATGISSSTASGRQPVSAYRGASATGAIKTKAGNGAATPGTQVSGAVVGATTPPKLTTRAGRPPAKDHSALFLALGLAAIATLGAGLDLRRPRRTSRSPIVVAVQVVSDFVTVARRRGALAPAAAVLIGAAMIATPSITGMWTRAPKGAAMIKTLSPFMRPARLQGLQTDVSVLDAGFRDAGGRAPGLEFPNVPDARQRFASANPELSGFVKNWPAIHRRFVGLLQPMRANRSNYDAVASLPSFRLFPWFLLAPGALLVLLGATALALPRAWRKVRWGAATLGAALVLAPLAFGLYGAGPKGARLITAFHAVETRSTVTAIQNDFGALAIGQGSLRTELPSRVADSLPAVRTLNRRWVGILGDFTPMLGVMSDNVPNYQAVAALPDFSAFAWLFAVPGLLVIATAALGAFGAPSALRRLIRTAEPQLGARSNA